MPRDDDLSRAERILAVLAPDDAAWARERLLPPWQARARRLAQRDEAVRWAAAVVCPPGTRPTTAAKTVADALARYLTIAWPREAALDELPPDAPQSRIALHTIAKLNGGSSLGWRQIKNLLDLHRGEECRKNQRKLHRGSGTYTR